jgi:hypothetical protein
MVVRCGPSGYKPLGGHLHFDQLSICLTVEGLEILIDPGQFCYTSWPDKSMHYRSTGAHNTVTVDNRLQTWGLHSPNSYCYSIYGNPRPMCEAFEASRSGARFVGRHSGYSRLVGGGDHRRTVQFNAETLTWTVIDTLNLRGPHHYAWRFCLHPEVRVNRNDDMWLWERADVAVEFNWIDSMSLETQTSQGWYSPCYGRQEHTDALVTAGTITDAVKTEFTLRACRKAPQPR